MQRRQSGLTPVARRAGSEKELRKIVRRFIRDGYEFPLFVTAAEKLFVLEARNFTVLANGRANLSAIAAATGVPRRRAKQILQGAEELTARRMLRSPVESVLVGWLTDKRFADKNGTPRKLLERGASAATFASLVAIYGKDTPSKAILSEMLRRGLVRRCEKSQLELSGIARGVP